MRIDKLGYVIYKMNLLSLKSIFRLISSILTRGLNLSALLHFSSNMFPHHIAIHDSKGSITYEQLNKTSTKLANYFYHHEQIKAGIRLGFVCRNHTTLVQGLFAASRVGADIFLLNPSLSISQLRDHIERFQLKYLIVDNDWNDQLEQEKNLKVIPVSKVESALRSPDKIMNEKLPKTSGSKLMLLTGGTTGKSKQVAHKPSIFNYLNPFLAILTKLKLLQYKNVFIATPIFHGYGLAILLAFLFLGKKVFITEKFNAETACHLISEYEIEAITVVPLMIQKMLQENPKELHSLRCIASGGAELSPKLILDVQSKLGPVLYNLYGTSETGLNMIATPHDLQYSLKTIGKKIKGMQLRVLDENQEALPAGIIGEFCIKNKWSMQNKKGRWVSTGDLGYYDQNGYFFLMWAKR